MTVYAFPSITPSSSSVELITNTRTFQSPITGAVQTVGRKGSMWKISMKFNNLSGADRATMKAFLTKLNGQEHRMYLQDHSAQFRGSADVSSPDTLEVNGAGQTGSILVADGATAGVSNYFRAGDYISFNNELHVVTEDVDSITGGTFQFEKPNNDLTTTTTAGIPLAPPIRKPTNNDNAIDYVLPVVGVFMLASASSWDTRPGLVSNFTIEAVEDVLA
jgi:hypothetical protein